MFDLLKKLFYCKYVNNDDAEINLSANNSLRTISLNDSDEFSYKESFNNLDNLHYNVTTWNKLRNLLRKIKNNRITYGDFQDLRNRDREGADIKREFLNFRKETLFDNNISTRMPLKETFQINLPFSIADTDFLTETTIQAITGGLAEVLLTTLHHLQIRYIEDPFKLERDLLRFFRFLDKFYTSTIPFSNSHSIFNISNLKLYGNSSFPDIYDFSQIRTSNQSILNIRNLANHPLINFIAIINFLPRDTLFIDLCHGEWWDTAAAHSALILGSFGDYLNFAIHLTDNNLDIGNIKNLLEMSQWRFDMMESNVTRVFEPMQDLNDPENRRSELLNNPINTVKFRHMGRINWTAATSEINGSSLSVILR